MDISKNIKTIRETKGLKQSDIAKILEMERTNYHRLESRGEKLTIEQLQSIAGALGVSVGELLGIEAKVETNSEELESLRQRVFELEDRVVDKTALIKSQSENFEYLLENIEYWFCERYFYNTALKENIGKVNILKNGNVTKTVDIATFHADSGTYFTKEETPILYEGKLDYQQFAKVQFENYFDEYDKVKIIGMMLDIEFFGIGMINILTTICEKLGKIESKSYNISIDLSVFEDVLTYNSYTIRQAEKQYPHIQSKIDWGRRGVRNRRKDDEL